jgi:hypothetical protein
MIANIVMALMPTQSPQLSAFLLALSGAAATACHERARRQLRHTRNHPSDRPGP